MLSSATRYNYGWHEFRRKYERKPYDAYILFSFKGHVFQGDLKDISVGGAFIRSLHTRHLEKEDLVTISIPFTDGSKHVKRTGRVLWKTRTGFAITFYK